MNQIFNDNPSEPIVPLGLLKFLQEKFPLDVFKNVKSEGDLRRYQGAHDVIDFLADLHKRQQNEG